MSVFTLGVRARRRLALDGPQALAKLGSPLLYLLIGVELAVLAAWLPDTVAAWWNGDSAGDFSGFYRNAQNLEFRGLYSPRFPLLLHPLTYFSLLNAYRVYAALGAVALLCVAYLGQRRARSPEARVALALAILALPQMHWALRLGHMTPFLALAALGGFLLLRRSPVLAGLCFALLSIKPQYAVIPCLYLLWTRNGRALLALVAGAAALEFVAFVVIGFDAITPYLSTVWDWGVDARDDRQAVQVWQYAWPGFLSSAGLDPNPLVVLDLVLLSLAAVVLVWIRRAGSVALAAAAFGMLLVVPYSNFYDWGLIAVGGIVLLRADLPWRPLVPAILAGLFFAMLASQGATPYPAGTEAPRPGTVLGIYWITPALLAAVCLLALSSVAEGRPQEVRRDGTPEAEQDAT